MSKLELSWREVNMHSLSSSLVYINKLWTSAAPNVSKSPAHATNSNQEKLRWRNRGNCKHSVDDKHAAEVVVVFCQNAMRCVQCLSSGVCPNVNRLRAKRQLRNRKKEEKEEVINCQSSDHRFLFAAGKNRVRKSFVFDASFVLNKQCNRFLECLNQLFEWNPVCAKKLRCRPANNKRSFCHRRVRATMPSA